jgi:hypothetical protein
MEFAHPYNKDEERKKEKKKREHTARDCNYLR